MSIVFISVALHMGFSIQQSSLNSRQLWHWFQFWLFPLCFCQDFSSTWMTMLIFGLFSIQSCTFLHLNMATSQEWQLSIMFNKNIHQMDLKRISGLWLDLGLFWELLLLLQWLRYQTLRGRLLRKFKEISEGNIESMIYRFDLIFLVSFIDFVYVL